MQELYYQMIFKRKSFHRFTGTKFLSEEVMKELQNQTKELRPLVNHIQTEFRIVPREQTTCTRGEYCILIYSEVKEYYLLNIGYMAQQLDLWLASKNIGACWYGMGKSKANHCPELDFVIMIAIEQASDNEFRKDYRKAKRKDQSEIWDSNSYQEIAEVVRYAPSACNTQPWQVKCDKNQLYLYRVKGRRGMMPVNKVSYYNTIDMGIFMLFLELCLEHEKYLYTRKIYPNEFEEKEQLLTATYFIQHA